MIPEIKLPRKKGIFVTGTDTGVGKTLISAGIGHLLKDQGYNVGVFKPVASGCRRCLDGLESEDAIILRDASHCNFDLSVINPVTFFTPAAPSVCTEHENKAVDLKLIADCYNQICQESDLVIVEGIGGVKVPITSDIELIDMAVWFDLPVVIVARPDLGTINHTLLTIDAVRAAGLDLYGVVITGYNPETAGIAEETLPGVLQACRDVEILSVVPFDEQSDLENRVIGELVLEALSDCPWDGLIGVKY